MLHIEPTCAIHFFFEVQIPGNTQVTSVSLPTMKKKKDENHWPHGPLKPPTGHVRRKACVIQRRAKKAQSGPFWNGLIPSLTRSTDTPTYCAFITRTVSCGAACSPSPGLSSD